MKRSGLAQNKIDYIVYSNPKGAKELLEREGITPNSNIEKLLHQIKRLVRRKKQEAIKSLLAIHPEKNLLKGLNEEDHYCGSCQNYSYNPQSNTCQVCQSNNYLGKEELSEFLERLQNMPLDKLQDYYKHWAEKATKYPSDTQMANKVQLIWHELKKKVQKEKNKDKPAAQKKDESIKKSEGLSKDGVAKMDLLIGGALVLTGIFIGALLSKRSAV